MSRREPDPINGKQPAGDIWLPHVSGHIDMPPPSAGGGGGGRIGCFGRILRMLGLGRRWS